MSEASQDRASAGETSMSSQNWPGLNRIAAGFLDHFGIALALIILALALALSMIDGVSFLFLEIPRNYNEGFSFYAVQRVLNGEPLYPDPQGLFTNSYPPLFIYVVALMQQLGVSEVAAGRLLSFVSTFVVALNVGLVSARLSRSWTSGIFSFLLFPTVIAAFYWYFFATHEPNLFGLAIQSCALVLFVFGSGNRRLIGVAALILLSGLTKHSLIGLPTAITVWLLIYDRRGLLVWLAACLGLVAAALVLVYAIYGSVFFKAVSQTGGVWLFGHMLKWTSKNALILLPFLIGAVVLFAVAGREKRLQFLFVFLVVSAATGAFTVGNIGAVDNHFFEFVVALCIAMGVLVQRLAEQPFVVGLSGKATKAVAMFALIQTVILYAAESGKHAWERLASLPQEQASFAEDIKLIAAGEGPAACEWVSLCFWAGKDLSMSFDYTYKQIERGVLDEHDLIDLIANQDFSVIQIKASKNGRPWTKRLTPRVMEAVNSYYKPERFNNLMGWFLVPKRENQYNESGQG